MHLVTWPQIGCDKFWGYGGPVDYPERIGPGHPVSDRF